MALSSNWLGYHSLKVEIRVRFPVRLLATKYSLFIWYIDIDIDKSYYYICMKHLDEYLLESLKTVQSKKGRYEYDSYDTIQVIDRKFSEEISDEDFKKFIKQDLNEVFKLKASELNKGMDKIIDDLVAKEIENKMPFLTKWSEKYKRQSSRDKFIEDSKAEIRERILKTLPMYTIDTVSAILNPMAWYDARIFVYSGESKRDSRHYKWNDEAIEVMLDELNQFSIRLKDEERHLRDGVIGWTIDYAAYNGTKCPKNGCAHLTLKLNKETENIVKSQNKSYDDMVSAYYDSKGTGEYTGD